MMTTSFKGRQALSLMCLVMSLTIFLPAHAEVAPSLPACFAYAVNEVSGPLPKGGKDLRAYPQTVNQAVNERLKESLDRLADSALSTDAVIKASKKPLLDSAVYAQYLGDSTASFLIETVLLDGNSYRLMGFDTLTVDILTGEPITLSTLFSQPEEAAQHLSKVARGQINERFVGLDKDDKTLETALAPDQILDLPFTLTAGSLRLHLDLAPIAPGRTGLFHLKFPLPSLGTIMRPEARKATDCSQYTLCALTFDDGPHLSATRRIVTSLRNHAAMGSFFMVGKSLPKHGAMLPFVDSAGMNWGYHGYSHDYEKNRPSDIQKEWDKFCALSQDLVGQNPAMMRAPGGLEDPFRKFGMPIPVVHSGPGHHQNPC